MKHNYNMPNDNDTFCAACEQNKDEDFGKPETDCPGDSGFIRLGQTAYGLFFFGSEISDIKRVGENWINFKWAFQRAIMMGESLTVAIGANEEHVSLVISALAGLPVDYRPGIVSVNRDWGTTSP